LPSFTFFGTEDLFDRTNAEANSTELCGSGKRKVVDKVCVSKEPREPQLRPAKARKKTARRSQAAARDDKQPQKMYIRGDFGRLNKLNNLSG